MGQTHLNGSFKLAAPGRAVPLSDEFPKPEGYRTQSSKPHFDSCAEVYRRFLGCTQQIPYCESLAYNAVTVFCDPRTRTVSQIVSIVLYLGIADSSSKAVATEVSLSRVDKRYGLGFKPLPAFQIHRVSSLLSVTRPT